ncbi:MAG: TIM barrel protein [Planctomycetales bacterium]|nr:TIM barrel protein [Planctomycetales bacterium]
MYKNLNSDLIGISGRQSEIIELALTYGFAGIDIDMADLVRRVQRTSFDSATRFLTSSKLKIGGWEVPICLDSDDATFAEKLGQLSVVAEIAGRCNATTATLKIPSATNRLPFPEYFEVIRKRIQDVANALSKDGVRVALYFCALPLLEKKQFTFVNNAETFLALLGACNNPHVGFAFDSWAWQISGGAADQFEDLPINRALAVRVADYSEDVDLRTVTINDRQLPGQGKSVDNTRYLKSFVEAKLDIPVTAMSAAPVVGVTREVHVANTQNALDALFSEAGLTVSRRKPEALAEAASSSDQTL